MLVAQHLDFDMAGIDDEFFDEDTIVAERRLRLRLGETEAFGDLGGRVRDAHALSAAASRRLDHHGIADLVGDLHRMRVVLDDAEVARHGRYLGFGRRLLGFDLIAHRGDRASIRSDENDACIRERARKRLSLGQEAVAGMHGLRAGLAASLHDLVDHEIAFGRCRRADQNGLIGQLDVKRVSIRLRVHGNGFDTHAPGRLDDPAGDLAAVGNQNSFEHVFVDLQSRGGILFPDSAHNLARRRRCNNSVVQKN